MKQAVIGPEVPMAVFDNLYSAKENDLKVILYVLKKGDINLADITGRLQITVAAAQSALLFWRDKGLVLPIELSFDKPRKRLLTRREILKISDDYPEVGILLSQLQGIFGGPLNEKVTNTYMDLYLRKGIPVEVILVLTMFYAPRSKGPSYIAKIISNLYEKKGINTLDKAEEYLKIMHDREIRYREVARFFGLDEDKLTTSEKTIIDGWGEKLNMSNEMIKRAKDACGININIRYCNGILKSWSQKGYTKPEDVKEYSRRPVVKDIPEEDDVMLNGMDILPVYDKGE